MSLEIVKWGYFCDACGLKAPIPVVPPSWATMTLETRHNQPHIVANLCEPCREDFRKWCEAHAKVKPRVKK
jgi:hypothetical protein